MSKPYYRAFGADGSLFAKAPLRSYLEMALANLDRELAAVPPDDVLPGRIEETRSAWLEKYTVQSLTLGEIQKEEPVTVSRDAYHVYDPQQRYIRGIPHPGLMREFWLWTFVVHYSGNASLLEKYPGSPQGAMLVDRQANLERLEFVYLSDIPDSDEARAELANAIKASITNTVNVCRAILELGDKQIADHNQLVEGRIVSKLGARPEEKR